jgi:hypothetical protein
MDRFGFLKTSKISQNVLQKSITAKNVTIFRQCAASIRDAVRAHPKSLSYNFDHSEWLALLIFTSK